MNRKDSNYPQAFFYFQKAMTIDKQEKFMDWYVSDLTNILNLPLQEVTDSASIYINQMLENLSAAHPDLQAKAYNNIGRYYEMQEKEDSAKYYYQKAIQTSKSSPYRAYLNLAKYTMSRGNLRYRTASYNKLCTHRFGLLVPRFMKRFTIGSLIPVGIKKPKLIWKNTWQQSILFIPNRKNNGFVKYK